MMANQNDLQTALCQFLPKYHSSPHSVTGKTPASMMFNREIRTRLSLLLPDQTESNQAEEEEVQDKVRIPLKLIILFGLKYIYEGIIKWIPGKIVEEFAPYNYKVQTGENVSKRHINQLCYRYSKQTEDPVKDDFVHFPFTE